MESTLKERARTQETITDPATD